MKKMKIPITRPVIDDSDRKNILKPLESGWLVQGPCVAEFERVFRKFTKSKFAKAVSSCTAALHLSLEALGIKAEDRVVAPSFTYVASANSIEYTGAKTLFCDIDIKTFNIDVNRLADILEKDRSKRIKAVIPVNLFGLCADLTGIIKLAKRYNIKVIEDSACGLGAYIDAKHSGTFGDIGCFSFHPRKPITTGEGGMVITDSLKIDVKISSLRDHGAAKTDLNRHNTKGASILPEFNIRGYNYRMTDLQGALGISQMKKAEEILEKRIKIAQRYNKTLRCEKKLSIPYVPPGYIHSYQSYVCLFTNGLDPSELTIDRIDKLNKERNGFMMKLEAKGISTRQGTHAVHTLGYYKNKYRLRNNDYPSSYAADRLSIALPLYSDMTDKEFDYVISNIAEILN
jgi:dTDP-4-amino-4,6-dideoxygalactose transaminase